MDSFLTVITPAENQDLTTLETVKAELGITNDLSDDRFLGPAGLIAQASGICAEYCRRSFGRETLTETFRQSYSGGSSRLYLTRRPILSVTSVEEDGVAVAAADYELNAEAGMLRRLSNDAPSAWYARKIVVEYVGGYLLLDAMPFGIERACIELIKNYWSAGGRDASLKRVSITTPDVETIEQEFWIGAAADPALPREVTDLLDPHRQWIVA